MASMGHAAKAEDEANRAAGGQWPVEAGAPIGSSGF
jgi:hypothetical protein